MNWDLKKLCKDDKEFEEGLNELKAIVTKTLDYKGKLANEKDFIEFLLLNKEFEEKVGKVYMYAHLGSDLDTRDINNANKLSLCMNLFNELSFNTSFYEPEVLSLGYDKTISFINNNKEIEEFRFSIEDLFRKAKYTLDAKSEELLAIMRPMYSQGGEMYSKLSVADRINEKIDYYGKEVEVSQGSWIPLVSDAKDEDVRAKVFEALYKYYDVHKNTYAKMYEGILKTNKAKAKAKGFDSILSSYLYRNNIPNSVYLTLLDVAEHENASLKKYLKLRAKALKIKEYHTYDRFLQLSTSSKKYTYEEAKSLYFDSIKSCPKDFQDKAHSTLEEGYVDVYEKPGKRSGAYSSSMPNVHPFILMNFEGTLDSVFTLAHESGHSIHSMYSEEAQPSTLSGYTIFVAEIASTFNEHMLLDYLMKSDDLGKEDKIALLQKAIDEIYSTFYRQALFASYEYRANKLVEEDKPINHEVLSQIMIDLYKEYYDLDIEKEGLKKYVWCYIPHLYYTPFYVYQYATSFAASFALYKNVKEKKEGSFERYINLLKAGGSKYPLDEAKDAGIDFTKKETFMAVVQRIDELVSQLEKLLGE